VVSDLRRTRDSAEVDAWIRRDFPDADTVAGALSDELNICLAEGEGGAIFVWRGPGIYEAHCFFEQRGRAVIDLTLRMLDYLRREHGATMFWAAIPDDSRKVKIFVRLLGWKPAGHATFAHGRCQLFIGE
jgi:hypothetical protein